MSSFFLKPGRKVQKVILFIYLSAKGPFPRALACRGRKCVKFWKTHFFVFFGFWLLWVQKKSSKKFLIEIRKFLCFTVSVDFCELIISETITFFDIRPEKEKFCWDSEWCPRNRCRPPPTPPLPPSPQKRVFFSQFSTSNISEDFTFFDIWPRAKCVLLALLHPWFPPSKAPLKIGEVVMSSILTHDRMKKKSNFPRRFQLFPHLTESKISWCFPSSPSPRDSCHRDCHGLNSYDQPKKPLSRYFFSITGGNL